MPGKREKIYSPEAMAHKLPLFRGFTAGEMERFIPLITVVSAGKGERIFREGDEGDSVYIIVMGSISVLKSSPEGGKEERIAILKSGELMGYLALVDGRRRSASCMARTRTVLYRIGRKDFEALFMGGDRASFKVIDFIAKDLSRKLRDVDEKIVRFYMGADKTVKRLLKHERHIH